MIEVSTKGVHIICYYAQEDKTMLNELNLHLSVLKRHGLITTWSDRSIEVEEVSKTDFAHLEMDIIFLLISHSFLSSAFCNSSKIKDLLRLHKSGRIQIIPIILEPVDWKDSPFSALEKLPLEGKAITSWSNIDDGFYTVCKALHGLIQKHLDKKQLLSEKDAQFDNNKPGKKLQASGIAADKVSNRLTEPKLPQMDPYHYEIEEEYLRSLTSYQRLHRSPQWATIALSTNQNNSDSVQGLFSFLANDFTKQSYFEQTCARHLTRHQLAQRNAWDTVKPTLFAMSKNPAKLEWPVLLMFSLDQQLSLAQGWLQPLVLSLIQESKIKQNFAQKLMQGSGKTHWITFYVQNLDEESKLEQSCAMQLKINLALQKETTEQWLFLLKKGGQEEVYTNPARLGLLLQHFDEHIRSEQKALTLLEQGLNIQTKNEQLWIAIIIQYLGKPDQFKQILAKLPFQFPTEQDWIKTVLRLQNEQNRAEQAWTKRFLQHTREDYKVEQKIKEIYSSRIDEQIKPKPLPNNQTWQSYIQEIEERLEKHIQIKQEVTEKLVVSLERQGQTKQEAANLLALV